MGKIIWIWICEYVANNPGVFVHNYGPLHFFGSSEDQRVWLLKKTCVHTKCQLQTRGMILSRASEAGYPTNPPWAPGSDKTRGQGSFGPFTGGLDLLAEPPTCRANKDSTGFLKETNRTFDSLFTKTGWAWHATIFCMQKWLSIRWYWYILKADLSSPLHFFQDQISYEQYMSCLTNLKSCFWKENSHER